MIRTTDPDIRALSPVFQAYFGLTERQATFLASLYVSGERRTCHGGIVPAIREAMVAGAVHTTKAGSMLTTKGLRECRIAVADLRRAA